MALTVSRSNVRLIPDHKKVIPRFFNTGNERSLLIIERVLKMEPSIAEGLLKDTLNYFSSHYRDIGHIFLKHFHLTSYLITQTEQQHVSETKKLLIGSYFTMEYSIEAAALFNPSIVEDPDQKG